MYNNCLLQFDLFLVYYNWARNTCNTTYYPAIPWLNAPCYARHTSLCAATKRIGVAPVQSRPYARSVNATGMPHALILIVTTRGCGRKPQPQPRTTAAYGGRATGARSWRPDLRRSAPRLLKRSQRSATPALGRGAPPTTARRRQETCTVL